MIKKYLQPFFLYTIVLTILSTTQLSAEITQADYYFNDPGNTHSSLDLDVVDGIATATGTGLATTGLESGIHVIYSRLYDDSFGWGAPRGIPFLITQTEVEHTISAAEYYFDSPDNTAYDLDLSVSEGIATATGTNLSTDGLESGLHIIYSRLYADNYGWGAPRGIPFIITSASVTDSISAAEYFIDSDPGLGSGESIELSGSASDVAINTSFNIEDVTPVPGTGLHTLTVRLYSEQAGWGPGRSAIFLVGEDAEISFIQSAQYFIGNTPETSDIITVSSPEDGTFDELNEALNLVDIEIPDGATGLQNVGVRFQKNNGYWSEWRTTNFLIVNDGPEFTITGAEYFLDIDPGPGSGTAIEAPVDGTFDEIEEEFNLPVSVDGLELGGHYAYLRLKRSDGSWGPARGNYFIVSEDAQPTIAAAEYYFDAGTLEGAGFDLEPTDGAFNTFEEDAQAEVSISTLGLDLGIHQVYVRYMNSQGVWGQVVNTSLTIDTKPQISISIDTLSFASLFTGDSTSLAIDISNIGDEDLDVYSIISTDPAFTVDWVSGTIPPENDQNVTVQFKPTEERHYSAQLTIASNDETTANYEITLLGDGIDTAPIIALNPDSLDFGTVHTISNRSLPVFISNSGNEILILQDFTATNSAFSAQISPDQEVQIGDTVEVDIIFAPTMAGNYSDTLYINSNDSYNSDIPLYVTGVGSDIPVPDIQITTTNLNFGNISLDDDPVDLILIISNNGNETLNISSMSVDNNVFTSSHTGSQILGEGESVTITITFTPVDHEVYSGQFSILSDDPDTPTIFVGLTGSSVFAEMEIGIHTYAFGEVGVTSEDFREFTIENSGSDTLRISEFEKSDEIDTVITLNFSQYNIAPDRSKTFVLTFTPAEPVEYSGTVIIHSNDNPDTLYITGTGLDDEPPEIVFNPETLEDVGTVENTPISISAPITDNNQVNWVRLYYRQGGKATYDSTEMELEDGAYHGEIPAVYVKNRGVEYFIKAFDGANEQVIPETAPEIPAIVRVRLPSLPPFAFTAEEYGMISAPSDLDLKHVRTSLEGEIGTYDIDSWRLFRWINGNYVELSENDAFTFEPGNAYWLITADRQVITLDSSTSVKTNEDYLISLDQGWNQVGTPYYFPVSWNDVYTANPNKILGPIAYEWLDNEWQPATIMQPFRGYFIKTISADILQIPPNETVASAAKSSEALFSLEENEWVVQIGAENGKSRDRFNFIGVLNDAEPGGDLRDQPKPPAMYPDRVRLYSEHSDWGEFNGVYSGDFQTAQENGNYWDLTLNTGDDRADIRLSQDFLGDLPENYGIKILNLDLRYALPENSHKQFTQRVYSPESVYHLRVLIGDEGFMAENDEGIGFAPTRFNLSQNYPNPFNGDTRILFEVPEPTAIKVVIYDLAGRQVRSLIHSDAHAVGYHELSWNGNDNSGHHVASGIYLVSFQSPKFRATRKMVLLK